jgi:hypothetical protein
MTSNNYVDISTVVAKIKKDFLYGSIDEDGNKVFLTLKILADNYNVSYNTLIKNYSTPEKWGAEKKDVRLKIDQKIKEKKSEREAEKIVQIDSEYESAFSKLRKLTVKTIGEDNEILINSIKKTLKNEAIKLLIKSIMSLDEKNFVLSFIDYLKDNYDGKNSISVTDPECLWMMDKDKKIGFNYNYQVAVDDKNDFIVEQRLVNDPTDHHQLIPMMETVKMNLGKHPDFYTADNGYLTTKAVEYLYKHNIKAIIPDRDESTKFKNKKKIKKIFSKANFQYKWADDTYICPKNKILKYQNNQNINNMLHRVYSTNKSKNCEYLKKCTKGRKKEIFHLAHPLRIKM